MTMHFTQFIKDGWQLVDGACFGDGRQVAYYKYGLENGEHNVKITVVDGTLQVDAVEYQ